MIIRWLAVVGLVVGLVVAAAGPAGAHAGGLPPRDSRAVVTGIEPAVPGLAAQVVNNGTQLELRNTGAVAVSVPADSVERQERVVPAGATVRYSDARVGLTESWRVPLRTSSGTAAVVGRVEWPSRPSLVWWLLLTAGLAAGAYLVGRSRWWRPGLAATVVAVTAASIVHAVGSARAVSGQSFVPLLLGASGVGLVCWPLAVVVAVAAARHRPSTAFVAAIVGAALVVAGIPDFDSFRYAALPFAGPSTVDRLLVALTLGGGIGLATGGFAALRRGLVVPAAAVVLLAGCSAPASRITVAPPTAVSIAVAVEGDTVRPPPHRVDVTRGQPVTITVSSTRRVEVHVHGYDLLATAAPDHPATLHFTADRTGGFDVEAHPDTLLVQLAVR